MHELTSILLNILLPILILIALGAWLRMQFNVDLGTLGKINIYLFVPGFVYQKVSTSSLPWSDMGGIMVITVTQVLVLGAVVWGLGRLLRVNRMTLAAVAIAVMFYNSGNYGLPLAELAYPGRDGVPAASTATSADGQSTAGRGAQASGSPQSPVAQSVKNGGAVQAFVVLTQNVLTFTVGLSIAAWAGAARWTEIFTKIFRLPVLYVLASALLTRWLINGDASKLPIFIAKPAEYLAAGLVPVALVTLGAQLAANPRWPRWRPIAFVLVLRLIFGPIQMLTMLWVFHKLGIKALDLWPWPAELLILTAAVPTAVNTLLITLELEGDAELAADCVFWTTIFSCITIVGWLLLLRAWF
ncbi:AEC family transporter [Fontivita pretiosa]|uniref:AEC family transporter n=1 Tax=Fontivita pretiosa TaxID=2989684 RepID=UPI003D169C97